ncbi:MAG TPA: secretion system protein, partial [Beutenbergiaceae bacterium]|nr:secretion system protein [Beutenbergiaceae bacterium]
PTPLLNQLARSIRANRSAHAKQAAARLAVQLVLPVGLCLLPAFILLGIVPLLVTGSLSLFG